MGMAFKIVTRMAVCYLAFSWFLSTVAAIPATRSLRSSNEIKSLPQPEPLPLDGGELMEGGGTTYQVEGRMEMETNDYEDPGPNMSHYPPPLPPATA